MMKTRTKVGIGVAVLILGGAAAFAAAAGGGGGTPVRVATAVERNLVATVTANGWIRPGRAVNVQADVMGRVVDLDVQEGDAVSRGQLLLRIDATQYEAAVARVRAGVSEALAREAQARANLLQARLELDRFTTMRDRDSTLVSAQQFEEAQTQAEIQRALHEAAGHAVEQARAALAEAEDRLAKTVIRAPIDGIITRLNIEEGETAIVGTMNNPGSLLLTISDLAVMEAVVKVDETDIPELREGDSAAVRIDAFPRRSFAGRVTEIGHSAIRPPESLAQAGQDAQAVDFEVVITLADPPPSLRPDLSATADVVTAVRDSALSVPIIALTVRERAPADSVPLDEQAGRETLSGLHDEQRDREGVFLVRDGTVHFTPVEIGIAGREHFEVLGGLAPGDSVVAGPYDAIRGLEDGQQIRVLPDAAPPAGGAGGPTAASQ